MSLSDFSCVDTLPSIIIIAILTQGGRSMKKRILSILLTLALTLSLLPASALAAVPQEITLIADEERTLEIDGHSITFIARAPGATMIQTTDSDVADGTFIVMTSGDVDVTLAPGQTLTVAYLDDDGGYTNACPIQAAETNTDDVALLLRGGRGLSNAVVLGNGVALTMDGILYEFTPDVNNPSLTMDFHMNLDSPTSEYSHTSGSLKISAPDDYTGIFNGYDFAEGCTEAEFRISKGENHHSVNTLIRGAIALDEGESVTVNGVPVVGAGSTIVTMDEATGIATVEGSAIIGGALELYGNFSDDDFPAVADITGDGSVTLREGQLTALKPATVALDNGGTVSMAAETQITYSSQGNYLELAEGVITTSDIEDTVVASFTDYFGDPVTTANVVFSPEDDASCTLETKWDGITLSSLSGNIDIVMEEGAELIYAIGDDTKLIKAQSYTGLMTIRRDGSIEVGEDVIEPDADGNYLVGAAHETATLGGFTVYGNPDGVSYDEENGVLTIHTKGSYEISASGNAAAGAITDTIEVSAPGSNITLEDVRIEAAAGDALTITADDVILFAEGSNSLTGGNGASGLAHTSESLAIKGTGTLTVIGKDYPAVSNGISVDSTTVIATGAEGIYGDVTVFGGSVTATGTTHAGIIGNVTVNGGSVTATGGTGGNGDAGEPGIAGKVSIGGGSVTVTGGSAVPGSSGVGGTGITGNVTVENGTVSVTGGANGSGGTAPAIGDEVSAHNVTLMSTAENTGFTLHAKENSVQLSNISGSADIILSGGSLILQDASGNKQSITANDSESGAELTIDSVGSITGGTENVTIAVIPTPVVAGRYYVTVEAAENGTVTADTTRCYQGDQVTLTVTPDEGYVLKSLKVARKTGKLVTCQDNGDGTYTFPMPITGAVVTAEFALAFEDIEADHQFYDAIEWVYQQKLMIGVTEATFDRVSSVTRQQVWRVLARLTNGEDPGSMAAARDWAVANSIADGTEPGAAATRQEFVTMLWLACGKPAADADVLVQFSDAAAVSADASAAMAWAVREGIVGGYEDGTLRPTATATRGAFAAILYRYFAE